MITLTKLDWNEIQSRIDSRVCPYCGGSSKIELDFHGKMYSDVVVFHKTISCCCDDYRKIIQEIINQEHNNQIQKKINKILNM